MIVGLEAFPNLAGAINGVVTAWKSGVRGLSLFKTGMSGLKIIITSHPYVTLAVAIIGVVTALKSFAEASANASKEADELKQKSMEEAKAARDEVNSLNELIQKYQELANSDEQDSGTREEIRQIQNDITDLVGSQADNLDLVNGKLDDEIDKLNEIRKKEADKALRMFSFCN